MDKEWQPHFSLLIIEILGSLSREERNYSGIQDNALDFLASRGSHGLKTLFNLLHLYFEEQKELFFSPYERLGRSLLTIL